MAAPPDPPRRIDGYTVGAIPHLDGVPPHRGEIHPDGDEFLYVVSGRIELILDDGDAGAVGAETKVLLRAGDAYVVLGRGALPQSLMEHDLVDAFLLTIHPLVLGQVAGCSAPSGGRRH